MFDQHIVLLGALGSLFGSGAYIRDTLRGRSAPNRATFFLWAVAPAIAFAAELREGIGWVAVPTLVVAVMPAMILVASFIGGHAAWKLRRFDYACAALSVLAIVLWQVTGSGDVAIAFSLAADFLAGVPTALKSWTHPETETVWAYVAGGFNGILGLLTATTWNFASIGFNAYLVVFCTILVVFIAVPRRRRVVAAGESAA